MSRVKCIAQRATLDIDFLQSLGGGMNTTEGIMPSAHQSNALEAQSIALEAAGTAIALVHRVPTKYKGLADQAIRSAASVPANLAEGHGRNGKDRFYHYRIAYGSAKEIDVHLRLLNGAGVIDANRATEAIALFDRVRAMLWRLIHSRR